MMNVLNYLDLKKEQFFFHNSFVAPKPMSEGTKCPICICLVQKN